MMLDRRTVARARPWSVAPLLPGHLPDCRGRLDAPGLDHLNTPPDGTDPHQEWIMFFQQKGGEELFD
jgi:hypothetical protein